MHLVKKACNPERHDMDDGTCMLAHVCFSARVSVCVPAPCVLLRSGDGLRAP